MMLPKESKNKATIEQKKYQLIENHKYFFFHFQMIQGSFHINVRRNHFFFKSVYNFKWNRNEMDEIINDQREKWCDGL